MDVFLRDALSREAVVHPPKLGGVFTQVCSLTHTRLTSLAEQSL